MRAFTLILPVLCILLASCGGGSDDSAGADSKGKPAADENRFDPCERLTEDVIRSHFEVGDAEISSRSSSHRRYATCIVNWPRPDHEALQEAYQKKIMEFGQAKARGETAEMPEAPRTYCELTCTVPVKRFDSPAQAQSALDSALDIMKNGLKTRPKTEEQRAKVVIEPVDGIGDKAAWNVGNNQISVANGRRMFHLTVNVYDDPAANRAKAMKLAALFLKDVR